MKYKQSLKELNSHQFSLEENLGQIHFYLGWSIICSKTNVDQGIENLRKANQILVNYPELMIKLAAVLY